MTALPRKHRDRELGSADLPRRTSGPPPGDDIAAGTASRAAGTRTAGGSLTPPMRPPA